MICQTVAVTVADSRTTDEGGQPNERIVISAQSPLGGASVLNRGKPWPYLAFYGSMLACMRRLSRRPRRHRMGRTTANPIMVSVSSFFDSLCSAVMHQLSNMTRQERTTGILFANSPNRSRFSTHRWAEVSYFHDGVLTGFFDLLRAHPSYSLFCVNLTMPSSLFPEMQPLLNSGGHASALSGKIKKLGY